MPRRANGEGSVYRRKDGLWVAALTLPPGRRRVLYARTRAEANRKLAAALRERESGIAPVSDRVTVADYLNHWLELIEPTVRPGTWKRYREYVRLHIVPLLGQSRLARLQPAQLQALYSRKLQEGLSPQSVRHLHALLHHALGQAVQWGDLPRNLADAVRPPRAPQREMQALSPDQAKRFLEAAAGDRLEALYVLALTTGMRQGELLGLRWQDIDLESGTLQVRVTLQRDKTLAEPKSAKSRRQVSLTALAVSALRRHRARQAEERLAAGPVDWHERGLAFTTTIGTPLDAGNLVRRSFVQLLERAGLPHIRFHDLRHSTASLLLALGVHPKVVQELLGHSAIGLTLDTYSHALPSLQREAVDGLDRLLG